MADVVLVIDMTHAFMDKGRALYVGDRARRIIPHIQQLLEKELSRGSSLLFLNDHHLPDDPEFKMFPPHAVIGTEEPEIIPELSRFPGEMIPKRHFSAFAATSLGKRLRELHPGKLIVSGVLTDICVCHTVSTARDLGYEVEVPTDCVASNQEAQHYFALNHMEKVLGARLTSVTGAPWKPAKFEPVQAILSGETADVYFKHSVDILTHLDLNPLTTMEIFPNWAGVFCGVEEVKTLLQRILPEGNSAVWAMTEGEPVDRKEAAMWIKAPYLSYGLYETAIIGTLAGCTGWATAARECVRAAEGIPVISFGARHVHPAVAGVMDYSAVVGGCVGCSSIQGARLAGIKPSGTMPHALILIMGDTVRATLAFDKYLPPEIPRVSLVDTFKDEAEESLRVAAALRDKLDSVRLDTPSERGRVTVDLVKEVRARLDQAGFGHVKIFVSGGLDPERIKHFVDNGAPVNGFGVGSYISGARPVDFKGDIKEIDGQPIAKRGRIPGLSPNPKLKRII
jgi:nicotinate phosphoribosyltransferase